MPPQQPGGVSLVAVTTPPTCLLSTHLVCLAVVHEVPLSQQHEPVQFLVQPAAAQSTACLQSTKAGNSYMQVRSYEIKAERCRQSCGKHNQPLLTWTVPKSTSAPFASTNHATTINHATTTLAAEVHHACRTASVACRTASVGYRKQGLSNVERSACHKAGPGSRCMLNMLPNPVES